MAHTFDDYINTGLTALGSRARGATATLEIGPSRREADGRTRVLSTTLGGLVGLATFLEAIEDMFGVSLGVLDKSITLRDFGVLDELSKVVSGVKSAADLRDVAGLLKRIRGFGTKRLLL